MIEEDPMLCNKRAVFFLLLALPAVLSCGGSSSSGPTAPPMPPPPGGGAFTFTQIQNIFFTPTCAVSNCHSTLSAQAGLVLVAGVAYGNIVDVPSTQNPALDRIEPGIANQSYLVKKLRGDADILGVRMPNGQAPLSQGDIASIIAWVQAGAPDN